MSQLLAACGFAEFEPDPVEPFACNNESWDEARFNPQRFIAHAGGEIDNRRYTNSRQAIDLAYEKGLRLLELDLIETIDGQLVAAHDWDAWRDSTASDIQLPTGQQFRESLLFGQYQPMGLTGLDQWFAQRPDAYLVTDKVTDFHKLLEGFTQVDRLIVEVFSVDDFHRALDAGVRYPMLSLRSAMYKDGEEAIIGLLRSRPVKFVAVSSKVTSQHRKLLARLRRNHSCVYVFTSSDPDFLRPSFDGLVYGAYTDGWDIRDGGCTVGSCDTY